MIWLKRNCLIMIYKICHSTFGSVQARLFARIDMLNLKDGSKFFPFNVDPFSEGIGVQKANRMTQKLSSLSKMAENLPSISNALLVHLSLLTMTNPNQLPLSGQQRLYQTAERPTLSIYVYLQPKCLQYIYSQNVYNVFTVQNVYNIFTIQNVYNIFTAQNVYNIFTAQNVYNIFTVQNI